MGLFNLLSQAKNLTKLANAVSNVTNMLDKYEVDNDLSYLLISSWVCKVGITDLIKKNNWAPIYVVYVPINGYNRKMSIAEAQAITIDRLKHLVSKYEDINMEETINDILIGGNHFYEIDKQIPQRIRNVIL